MSVNFTLFAEYDLKFGDSQLMFNIGGIIESYRDIDTNKQNSLYTEKIECIDKFKSINTHKNLSYKNPAGNSSLYELIIGFDLRYFLSKNIYVSPGVNFSIYMPNILELENKSPLYSIRGYSIMPSLNLGAIFPVLESNRFGNFAIISQIGIGYEIFQRYFDVNKENFIQFMSSKNFDSEDLNLFVYKGDFLDNTQTKQNLVCSSECKEPRLRIQLKDPLEEYDINKSLNRNLLKEIVNGDIGLLVNFGFQYSIKQMVFDIMLNAKYRINPTTSIVNNGKLTFSTEKLFETDRSDLPLCVEESSNGKETTFLKPFAILSTDEKYLFHPNNILFGLIFSAGVKF